MKNKKMLFIGGGLIVVAVIGYFLWKRNKDKTETTDTTKKPSNLATESDAMEIIAIQNKSNTPFSPEQTKGFIELYTTNIDKPTHTKIKSTMSKLPIQWTLEDRANMLVLLDKVTKPLADKLK
jgi:hypothetical protein